MEKRLRLYKRGEGTYILYCNRNECMSFGRDVWKTSGIVAGMLNQQVALNIPV